MKALMEEVVNDKDLEGGHAWKLTASHIKCGNCWLKLSKKCSKEASIAEHATPASWPL